MRLPRFLLAGTLACFLISVFIPPANSSYFSSNSISVLSKIPLALVFISKEINAREVWIPPQSVPGIEQSDEGDGGSITDEYSSVSNTFAKPGSKIIQEEEVISDQPYPYISLAEEWKLAHLQSPYVLKRKQGDSAKKKISSDEVVEENDDGDDPVASSSSVEQDQDEDQDADASSSQVEEEDEEEEEEPIPQGELGEPPADYSPIPEGPPLPQNEGSDEQGEASSEEEESEESSNADSKVPLQALSHIDEVDEDDSTETNLELIPEEVKDAIVREMAKQFAQQARISASKIKKEIKTTKPKRDHFVSKENEREVVRVTDDRVTNSDGPYNDQTYTRQDKPPKKDRVTNSDGPYHGGGGGGKGKKKKKGKGKGKDHGWKPPPKIWIPHPPPHHHHKPHIRDGLLEQWTKGSQWERIIHAYHDYKDQQDYDHKHGLNKGDGAGPLHRKPGLAEKLLKGSFWERAFVTYSNYKQKQQNKGNHELAGEGWAPYDR